MTTIADARPTFDFAAHIRRHNGSMLAQSFAYGVGAAVVWVVSWYAALIIVWGIFITWSEVAELPGVPRETASTLAHAAAWLFTALLGIELVLAIRRGGFAENSELGLLDGAELQHAGTYRIVGSLQLGLSLAHAAMTAPRWTLAAVERWRRRTFADPQTLQAAEALFADLHRRGTWVFVAELGERARVLPLLERAGLLWVKNTPEGIQVRVPSDITQKFRAG